MMLMRALSTFCTLNALWCQSSAWHHSCNLGLLLVLIVQHLQIPAEKHLQLTIRLSSRYQLLTTPEAMPQDVMHSDAFGSILPLGLKLPTNTAFCYIAVFHRTTDPANVRTRRAHALLGCAQWFQAQKCLPSGADCPASPYQIHLSACS